MILLNKKNRSLNVGDFLYFCESDDNGFSVDRKLDALPGDIVFYKIGQLSGGRRAVGECQFRRSGVGELRGISEIYPVVPERAATQSHRVDRRRYRQEIVSAVVQDMDIFEEKLLLKRIFRAGIE